MYFRDVTAERTAQQKLREQAQLLDRTQDAILARTLDHRIVYWNAGAQRMYGWSPEEAIGSSVLELLYNEPSGFERATTHVREQGEWTGELEQRRRDGSPVIVEGRWSLVQGNEGAPARILAVNTDITERKRLLEQFLRAQRMESIGTLAGGIAHDLNNVLAPILLSIEFLRTSIDDPTLRDTLAVIEASAQRGADMVRQVLGFARGCEGVSVILDPRRVLEEVLRVAGDTFPKNIRLHASLPDDLHALTGDPTQLHQVLMNLLVNARDALAAGGEIRVSADNVDIDPHYAAMHSEMKPGRYVRIAVADTGTGMSPDIVAQIFDPFFTTKEVGKGTGLGLSTVAAITRSHGGFVTVYSEPRRGTTFRVYFPAEPQRGVDAGWGDRLELHRGRGETILVVDDEQAIRDITRQTLLAFGYDVLTAVDGADAVAVYARQGSQIDLVLTDMVMPIMDGPTTIRALRRLNPDARIIAASGLGADSTQAHLTEDGSIRHFLPKPYTAETLLRVIHDVLHGD